MDFYKEIHIIALDFYKTMHLDRKIDHELRIWAKSEKRKPLVLRGARQIGKSTAVKHLALQFKYFIEINFDENTDYQKLFTNNLSVESICEQLAILTNTPIVKGKTLIFFDEIQVCLPAISSLRYFYEKLPDLHIIAAGSLLEFALAELPSFGVGRVRFMYMYPFSFEEFLVANKENQLVKLIQNNTDSSIIPELIHEKLKVYLKKFLIIGGMPEAVLSYVSNKNMLEVQQILDDLIQSIQADFTKYKNKVSTLKIKEVFEAVIHQIGNKFTYSYSNATLTNAQIKEALQLLEMAGLIYSVTHSSCNGIPLGAEVNNKFRKILIFDTGIFQRILGLNISDLMLNDSFNVINKGNIAELYVGLELLKNKSCYQKTDLYYWQREAKNSQAEIDYIIQKNEKIIPIEVKAGTKGSMQSMYIFMSEKNIDEGIRVSLENFGQLEKIKIYPLYAIGTLVS